MPGPSIRLRVAAFIVLSVPACDNGSSGGVHTVSSDAMHAYELSLAVADGHAAVAWHGGPTDHNDIYLQWLDSGGGASSPPLRLTQGPDDAYEPDLQIIGTTLVVGWYEKNPHSGATRAWLARTDAQGHELWRRPLSAAGDPARNPVVRLGANSIAVAWIEKDAVWAARYGLNGRLLSGPLGLGSANTDTWNLNAAVGPDGVFHVVYDAGAGAHNHQLRLAVLDHDPARNLALSPDDIAEVYPDLRFNQADIAALTWFEQRGKRDKVYFAVLPQRALDTGQPLFWRQVTSVDTSSFGSYLAWNVDRLEIAWCDNRTGTTQVYARSFDSTGRALGPERRLSHAGTTGSIPSVQPYGTGFLVAWNEYRSVPNPGHGHDRILSSVAVTARLP